MKRILVIISCLLTFLTAIYANNFDYRLGTSVEISPSDEMTRLFFDRYGVMWITTNSGLKSYDGYSLRTMRSDALRPSIFPNNHVMYVTDDPNDNLWIGTRDGIVKMNKRWGTYRTYKLIGERQRIIYTLFTTKDGNVWAGTDGGLSIYNAKTDKFDTYGPSNSTLITADGKLMKLSNNYSVKSITESNDGKYLFVGTWCDGLLRMRRGTKTFYQLKDLNGTPNAFSLHYDQYSRLWVGTWTKGVVCIKNPQDFNNPRAVDYCNAKDAFNCIYCIVEHPETHTLWTCSRGGISILKESDAHAVFSDYSSIGDNGTNPLSYNSYMAVDQTGNIWLQSRHRFIRQILTRQTPFQRLFTEKTFSPFVMKPILSIYTADGNEFLLSFENNGIAQYNRATHSVAYNTSIRAFSKIPSYIFDSDISSIVRRQNGELWMASNSNGILIVTPTGEYKSYTSGNCNFITDDYVITLMEQRNGTMWIGTRGEIAVVDQNGRGRKLKLEDSKGDFSHCDVKKITEAKDGTIWVATENEGILHLCKQRGKDYKVTRYYPGNHRLMVSEANACYEDSKGRLWAISNTDGLFRYDPEKDVFESVNRHYHIDGDKVFAINEDKHGNLWISTDRALERLSFAKGSSPNDIPQTTIYTKEDGLGDILFVPNSTAKYRDELYFGVGNTLVAFSPDMFQKVIPLQHRNQHPALIITDLIIDDQPYLELDSTLQHQISKEMPAYTRRITIPASIGKFSVEFALLSFVNPSQNRYAYKLEGYNAEWQYRDANTRRATFENLPSGTYQLRLKACDKEGLWIELSYQITVHVLPPWYLSWWAYLIYIVLTMSIVLYAIQAYKKHLNTQNKLQMQEVFTNITHELLTPLAVISASIDGLRNRAPKYVESYDMIQGNIGRLTRLLRQILEVRKSQAGQLRLLVSEGDISQKVSDNCDSFQPLFQQKNITIIKDIKPITGYFDSDKLENILYNLMSNALKYTPDGGKIDITLYPGNTNGVTVKAESAVLTVRDTGIGISKDKMKNLYQRFLDGDYRKMNVKGTGIGLSLVNDLVRLHHGNIHCDSKEGQGTTFTVVIPILRSAFSTDELSEDKTVVLKTDNLLLKDIVTPIEINNQPKENEGVFRYSILLVEDNIQLLYLMRDQLGAYYKIFTAQNGENALNVIAREELDVVITDVMMPVMDGIQLTKHIKDNPDTAPMPVVMLTAKTTNEDRNEGYAIGADEYITKPFRMDDLRLRIDNIMANRERIRNKFCKQTEFDVKEQHYSSPDERFLNKAIELVKVRMSDNDYDREKFASDMCVSSSTLYNKLRALTGQNISGFISSIRMKESCRIIRDNPYITVNELAAAVGFNTPKYFSRLFKKEFDMSPSEFCEQVKKGQM